MPNGRSYAVIRHRANGWRAISRDTNSFQRQEGLIVYQYFPIPGSEYPIYNFSLDPYSLVSRIPLYFDSVFVDTMRVWYWTQADDSVFGIDVPGWHFAFDPAPLAIDDEFFDVIVDSIGVIRSNYAFHSMVLVGALINGISYGTLTGISDTPNRPLPIQSRVVSYPDPFNASTTLRFNLDRPVSTTIRIYNILGHKVFEDNLGRIPSGPHNYVIHANNLPSGVYFYRVETEIEILSGRMLLVR